MMKPLLLFLLLSLVANTFLLKAQQNITFGLGNTKNVTVSSSSNDATGIKTLQTSGFLPNQNASSRFLSQATLGKNISQIQNVSTIGIESWVNTQQNLPNSFLIQNYVQGIHQSIVDSLLRDAPSGGYTLANTNVSDWHFDIAWFQSRYDKEGPGGTGKDYINCPLDKEQYYAFIDKLLAGDKTEFKEWEKDTPYFNGCLPIEIMAVRGKDTLRFGPMKPVGLTNPNSEKKPHAVLQLRQDNALGSLYNIVGFQTKLKYNDQKEIFSSIPGLEEAEFARYGGLHRNTFINSPKLLGSKLELKDQTNISFAGQITGVEGYVESAAMGLLAGLFNAYDLNEQVIATPPIDTAIGGLLSHLTHGADSTTFQPMNINFGLLPASDIKIRSKKDRNEHISKRALNSLDQWIQNEKIIK